MKAFDFGCAWYNNRASYLTFSSSSYKAALNKCDRLYTILQKNGGTDTKAMGQTEPHFLSDPMSDRILFSRQLSVIFTKNPNIIHQCQFPVYLHFLFQLRI
jgi:hypothetical protein